MIKLITFDLDNTLWDADPVLISAEQTLYQWLKANCPELAAKYTMDYLRTFKDKIARDNPELMHRVSALRLEALRLAMVDVGYDPKAAQRQAALAFETFHHARQQVTFFEHTLAILTELKRSYRLAALTNGNADVTKVGLAPYFEFALSADQVGKQKPEPAMFMMAMGQADVRADEAIHIGDHPEQDIMGAQDTGMHTIWVNLESSEWKNTFAPTAEANCLSEIPKLVAEIAKDAQ